MPSERRRQFSLVALALGNFVVGLSILLPTGMLAELSLGLGVPIGTVGLLISLGAGVVCVSPPLVAWITSRIDRRVLLSSILLWLALGHVASAFAPNYASLLVIRLAMLAFAGAFTPLAAGTAALLALENKARLGNLIGTAWLGARDSDWIAAGYSNRAADRLASDLRLCWHSRRVGLSCASGWIAKAT